ncbi:hypothetical protein [Marivivens aquimaris]|uniref:hypothetical protein n=1 Tax=Marivivens aquimaris TaxID=2774876 RepID=UPI00187E6E2B|nr:hypothetical protein [Marivivens aquimaris]
MSTKRIYEVTASAGPIVGGVKNPGDGQQITVSERAAEYDVQQGHLIFVGDPEPNLEKPDGYVRKSYLDTKVDLVLAKGDEMDNRVNEAADRATTVIESVAPLATLQQTATQVTQDAGRAEDARVAVEGMEAFGNDMQKDMTNTHDLGGNFATGLVKSVSEQQYIDLQAFEVAAQIRRGYGQSGIRFGRHYADGGDAAYHRPSMVSFAALGVHNHPNYRLMCGMPEQTAIINGHEINTRHCDYRIMHGVGGGAYLEVEDAIPPAVPPSVATKATPEEQVAEMREYLRAFGAKDASIRADYAQYFDTYVSVLECWLENLDGDTLSDTFPSFRHQIDNGGLRSMNDNYMSMFGSGLKARFENKDFKPTVIRVMNDDGSPQFAVLRYRISAMRLGTYADWPVHRMVELVDDPATRLRLSKTDDDIDKTRLGRYRVLGSLDDRGFKRRTGPTLLDDIMSSVPGLDGVGANIEESYLDTNNDHSTFTQRLKKYKTTTALNSAYYNRFYSYEQAGAAGRRDYRRGWNDPTLFVASTTKSEVAQLSGMGGGHRVSWAIPLELIVATPLGLWNPYDVQVLNGNPTGSGNTEASPYSGVYQNGYWFMTPSDLFDVEGTDIDPADTDEAAWVQCDDGEVRLMRGSGIYVHMPEISGIQTARLRYPIAPMHDEGSFAFGYMKAFETEQGELSAQIVAELLEQRKALKKGGLL